MDDTARADPSQRPWAGRLGIGAALFALALGWFLFDGSAPADELRIDEGEWISSGVHAWQLATTGKSVDLGATPEERAADAQRPWRSGIESSTFGWMNPLLPKLLFGAAAQASGVDTTTRAAYMRFQTGNARYVAARREHQRFAPALPATRFVVTLFGAAVAVLLFAVATRTAGVAAGLTAYALWLASPTGSQMADWVRTGLFPLAFGLAALWLVLARGPQLTGQRGLGPLVGTALLLGLLCGAAVGSKLNGALVSFAVPLWLLASWRAGDNEARPPLWRPALSLALTAAVCGLLFRLSLPGLWDVDPVSGLRRLLDAWGNSFDAMAKRANHDPVPEGLAGRLGLVGRRFFFELEPIRALTGIAAGVVLVPLATLAVGLRALRGALPAQLVLIHAVVLSVGTVAWLPLDAKRFFYPLVLVSVLLYAAALGAGAGLLARGRSSTSGSQKQRDFIPASQR
ncbi:MAG: hypothetical protein AAFZ65_03315 [Planctomycetota bacterium]